MKSDHSLDAMISNVNIIREEESSSHPQKRTRYDSDTYNNHKRFKPNQVDMDLSDGEDEDAEVVEIPPPLPEDGDDDDDIVEVQWLTFLLLESYKYQRLLNGFIHYRECTNFAGVIC